MASSSRVDQTQHPAVRDALGYQGQKLLVVHAPKEVLQVRIPYAVRSRWGFSTGEWQAFLRVTTDWVRSSAAEAREAERQALALTSPELREEAVAGVIRGYILSGDGERAIELVDELSDGRFRQDALALYQRYIR